MSIEIENPLMIENKFDWMINNITQAIREEHELSRSNKDYSPDYSLANTLESQLIKSVPNSVAEFQTKILYLLSVVETICVDERGKNFCNQAMQDTLKFRKYL